VGVKTRGLATGDGTTIETAAIRMIAVDMDGTLLGPNGRVSAENLAALRAAEQAGVEVVVATGRRHCYAMRILRELGLGAERVLVSSNGAVTRTIGTCALGTTLGTTAATGSDGTRLLERTLLARETALWLCGHLAEFRNALVITFDKVQPDGEDARGALVVEELEELHGSIGRWMEANAAYIEHVRPIEQALAGANGEAPIQMMLCGTIERMRRAEARLLEDPRVYAAGVSAAEHLATAEITLSRTEYPDRDLSLVDILPAGCSKGVALLRLAAGRGIAPVEMMAIGDNWNDLSMLEIAGRPVLMENAPEDLKAMARERGWRIGGHHDRHGVARAIEEVLLRSVDGAGGARNGAGGTVDGASAVVA
jgi:hydroxymethylpyrimidine pyrophosphatase-like HAD family hydrolase